MNVICEDNFKFMKHLAYLQLIKGHEDNFDYVHKALSIIEKEYPESKNTNKEEGETI